MQFFRVRCNWNGKRMYKLKLSVGMEFEFVKNSLFRNVLI